MKAKKKIKIGDVLNNPISLIIVLLVFSALLMIYNRYLIKSQVLYNFSGYTEEYSFMNGTIYTGYDINYFGDSKVIYTGKDIELYDFEAGYYIKNDNKYEPVATMEALENAESGASLKELLATTDFSFTEAHRDAKYLSKENIENIKNLVFKITGENKSQEKIDIEIPLEVVKVTK